jgi:hypothetical protein
MRAALVLTVFGFSTHAIPGYAEGGHKMQHGFVLAEDDRFAEHLVAPGHHSWQTSVGGELVIENDFDRDLYGARKDANRESKKTYFLLQAQNLDLTNVVDGQILEGHIIESKLGEYEPENVILRNAKFIIHKVHTNLVNPFFR